VYEAVASIKGSHASVTLGELDVAHCPTARWTTLSDRKAPRLDHAVSDDSMAVQRIWTGLRGMGDVSSFPEFIPRGLGLVGDFRFHPGADDPADAGGSRRVV